METKWESVFFLAPNFFHEMVNLIFCFLGHDSEIVISTNCAVSKGQRGKNKSQA